MTVVLYFGLIPWTSSLTNAWTALRISRVVLTSFLGSRFILALIFSSTSSGVASHPNFFASFSVTFLNLGSSSSIHESAFFSSCAGVSA